MIVIVNYGMGNLASVQNMLKKAGEETIISGDAAIIAQASKLILPGVGAFDNAMDNLAKLNLISVLNKKVLDEQIPILGICLGVQLFTKQSEEGQLPGLGWIEAETRRFNLNGVSSSLKIPHMGWSTVKPKGNSELLREVPSPPRFYFVHSYHVCCSNPDDVLATSEHGYEFTAAVSCRNILGTQFHPEKSHQYGLRLLKNFAAMPTDPGTVRNDTAFEPQFSR